MVSFPLSARMVAVQSPIIPVIGELIRTHPGTVSLGQGVAGSGPPESAKAKVLEFFSDPIHHKYGPVQGIPPLLEILGCKLAAENGIHPGGRKVVVTAGANMGFLNALFAIAKAYGFASWRIGYMVIPDALYPAVLKAQDTNLICAPLVSQQAAVGALETGSSYCRDKLKTIAKVREIVLKELEAVRDFCHIPPSDGAFYVFLKVATGMGSLELAKRLIREHGVAVIPGFAFGLDDGCYLRIAYGALDETTAAEGLRRLVGGLKAIVLNLAG